MGLRYQPGVASKCADLTGLILVAQSGDEDAVGELIKRSKKYVRNVARSVQLAGYSTEEKTAIGWRGFIKALRLYDPSRGAKWVGYLCLSVRREILSVLTMQRNRYKRMEAAAAEFPTELGVVGWEDDGETVSGVDELSPSEAVESKLLVEDFLQRLSEVTTNLEWSVLETWLEADTYIGGYGIVMDKLGIDYKSVDNALIRVRRKAKRVREVVYGGEV